MKFEISVPCYARCKYKVDIPEEFIEECRNKKLTVSEMIDEYGQTHPLCDIPSDDPLEWVEDGDIDEDSIWVESINGYATGYKVDWETFNSIMNMEY